MSPLRKAVFAFTIGAAFLAAAVAQTPDPPIRSLRSSSAKERTTHQKSVEKQPPQDLHRLQSRLDQAQVQIQQQQQEIDRLRQSLQESLESLQEQQRQLQGAVQEARALAIAANQTPTSTGTETANAQTTMASARASVPAQDNTQVATIANSMATVQQSLQNQETRIASLESPATIHYKGLSITPGGYFEAASLLRTRNENADIASGLSNTPLNGTSNSKLTEYRGSVRGSRLSMLVEKQLGGTNLSGYFESDFLGAAPTANYVQSSAFTPRLRQGWVQIRWGAGWSLAAGQLWSLATTDRKGIAVRSEYIPTVMDANYVVGWTWTRQRAVRLTKNFDNKVWAAFEIDEPENAYSAAYVPPNLMGLNTSQNTTTGVLLLPYMPNYSFGNSTTLAPDLLAKVAFEPGWGHYEIKAIGRFFRDRLASTATAVGQTNYSEGWGVGFGAMMPVAKSKMDLELEGMVGQGIGRYGAAAFPDVTLNPVSGRMLGLRELHTLAGIEYHPRAKVDVFTYAGEEYAGRYAMVAPNGSAAGYGSPLISYATCTDEVDMNSCSGANRNVQEVTVGYWFKLYQGAFGRIQYGNQVEYLHRNLWSGVSHTPQGSDLVVFSSVRFYLP
jgi:TolA-binding protein